MTSEGTCPDCGVPLGISGRCAACAVGAHDLPKRDRPDGDYAHTCAKCGERFSGYKRDVLCMVCLPDAGAYGLPSPTMPDWKAAVSANVRELQKDAARLDWLQSQINFGSPVILCATEKGPPPDDMAYIVEIRDGSEREWAAETIRAAIDRAMEAG